MARARSLKPSFFTNDQLAECDPLTRILFAGLWTIADREGRLEDRPKKIKAEVLPYDTCDVGTMLAVLASSKFIRRYTVGDKQYIQIVNFAKHQKPHQNEQASVIPAEIAEVVDAVIPATESDQALNDAVEASTTKVASQHNQGDKHSGLNPYTLYLNPITSLTPLSPPEGGSSATAEPAVAKQLDPQPEEKPKRKRTPHPKTVSAEPIVLPDWIPKTDWEDFLDMRRSIRKPMTGRAQVILVRKLEQLHQQGFDVGECLRESTMNSWQSVYPPKGTSHATTTQNRRELRGHAALGQIGHAADLAVEQEKSQGRVRSAAEVFNLDRERLLQAPAEPVAQLAYSGDGSPMRQHDDQGPAVFLGDAAG